ncbi:Hypothetical protein IALB_1226 [Ignavibacterium album JCM 16511]|uniref:Uncharacterized protein n=1 Tax=Ignavibacterium album (strain DSM 19864 / JCM 16511 / NBRC 101810 / Mat9-16) TaxID=945713 RepID=I0AIY0_IGNAJ|nr:Hypothetical protein IALB_1226 [Ignavibacterium album JCM 16511]
MAQYFCFERLFGLLKAKEWDSGAYSFGHLLNLIGHPNNF